MPENLTCKLMKWLMIAAGGKEITCVGKESTWCCKRAFKTVKSTLFYNNIFKEIKIKKNLAFFSDGFFRVYG